jgi:hypothetical protein
MILHVQLFEMEAGSIHQCGTVVHSLYVVLKNFCSILLLSFVDFFVTGIKVRVVFDCFLFTTYATKTYQGGTYSSQSACLYQATSSSSIVISCGNPYIIRP